MFEYMTVQEAAKLWEISERRIQKLCEENRIDGVVRLSRVWLIPKDAKSPQISDIKVKINSTDGLLAYSKPLVGCNNPNL